MATITRRGNVVPSVNSKEVKRKKMKKYIKCTIYKHDGGMTESPLQFSESHLIVKIAKENKWVAVEIAEMTPADFNVTFGIF